MEKEYKNKNLIIKFLEDKGLYKNEVKVLKLTEVKEYAENVLGIHDPDEQITKDLNEIRFCRTDFIVYSFLHNLGDVGSMITRGKWEYLFNNVEFIFLNKNTNNDVIIFTNDPGYLIGKNGENIKNVAKFFNLKLNRKLRYIVKKEDEE